MIPSLSIILAKEERRRRIHRAGRTTPRARGQSVDGAIIGSGLHLDGLTPLLLPASPSLTLPDGGALHLVSMGETRRSAARRRGL